MISTLNYSSYRYNILLLNPRYLFQYFICHFVTFVVFIKFENYLLFFLAFIKFLNFRIVNYKTSLFIKTRLFQNDDTFFNKN